MGTKISFTAGMCFSTSRTVTYGQNSFPDLFPHISFRHTADKPRFRVILPTTQVVTAEAYKVLFDGFALKLEDAGYSVDRGRKKEKNQRWFNGKRRSGLDWSKRTPASLFYLPCQAEDPSQSFFRYYDGPEREFLDPIVWIENGAIRLQPELPVWNEADNEHREINQEAVETAIREWKATAPGHGNEAFFMLGVRLRSAGMNPTQIESALYAQAEHGRSPSERRAQVGSIIKSLFENKVASR